MLFRSRGLARDHVRGHLWVHLAAMSGDARAVKYRDLVAKWLKLPQITQAQNPARKCQNKTFARCDQMSAWPAFAVSGACLCLPLTPVLAAPAVRALSPGAVKILEHAGRRAPGTH